MDALRPGLQEQARSEHLLADLLLGALAGFVATAPMTATMELMHRQLPRRERYPLPPSLIIRKITSVLGLRSRMEEEEHVAATLAAHFAYGAGAGIIYAPLARRAPLPPAIKGLLFGLIVWSANYLGLLPALGILNPATEHPARRNALMIAAHLVWGAVLAIVTDLAQSRRGDR